LVRTRFAPSPTGYLHIGGLRTALYSYLFAKANGGRFALRIEDTDQERLVEDATKKLIETLLIFDIKPDEGPGDLGGDFGPYVQSERLGLYKKFVQELLDKDLAYYCFCSKQRLDEMRADQQAKKLPPRYDGHCRSISRQEAERRIVGGKKATVRMKMPADTEIVFQDLIHGEVKFQSSDVDDQVILKSDGFPTYHLAVVVDDHLMEITHVIRGDEWIASTPKHIVLYQYFGWQPPQFAHVPPIMGTGGKKLSKREGDVSVESFLQKGYLKEALLNFIVLLGWHPGGDVETLSLGEMISQFSLERCQKSGAFFDRDKLDWLNGHYIRQLSAKDLRDKLEPFFGADFSKITEQMVGLVQERLKYLAEAPELLKLFLSDELNYDVDLLTNQKMKVDKDLAKRVLPEVRNLLAGLDDFLQENIKQQLFALIEKLNLKNGQVLWPLRAALTGEPASPGAFEVAAALGKEKCLERIDAAINKLS